MTCYSVIFPLAPGGRSRVVFEGGADPESQARSWASYAEKWFGPWELYGFDEETWTLLETDAGPYDEPVRDGEPATAGWYAGGMP